MLNADCHITTNTQDPDKKDTVKALQKINLHKYFKDIFCCRGIGFSKPLKDYFSAILDKSKVKNDNLVMVGNSIKSDIAGAKSFRINTILHDTGNQYPDYKGMKIANLIIFKREAK